MLRINTLIILVVNIYFSVLEGLFVSIRPHIQRKITL